MLYIHRGSLAILIWRNNFLFQKDIQEKRYPRASHKFLSCL